MQNSVLIYQKNRSKRLSVSLNLFHLERNEEVQNSINLMFQFGLKPKTIKPTRIAKDTVFAVDHTATNSIINNLKL